MQNGIAGVLAEEEVKSRAMAENLEETRYMPVNTQEAASILRVLICMARVDGPLSPEEKTVLEDGLKDACLPEGVSLDAMLNEFINLDEELRAIRSNEGRERAYNAAYMMAHVQGDCSSEQHKMLEHIRESLGLPAEKATLMGRVLSETREMVVPGAGMPIPDVELREKTIHDSIRNYAILTAVVGAIPLPVLSVFTDLLVLTLQVKMVREIGASWGHSVDRQAARSLMASVAGATGMRIAVHGILNVVPVLGMPVGAASTFGSTWVLGHVAHRYFAHGGKLDAKDMREMCALVKAEASAAYGTSKDAIAVRLKLKSAIARKLQTDLRAGRITPEEYSKKFSELK